jgi:hypothetical protein
MNESSWMAEEAVLWYAQHISTCTSVADLHSEFALFAGGTPMDEGAREVISDRLRELQ